MKHTHVCVCVHTHACLCVHTHSLGQFDVVLMANLLCRLPEPRACLERLGGPHAIVRPGGLAIVTSPFSWMEQFTPMDKWLGGTKDG
jgi:hypothetical protein